MSARRATIRDVAARAGVTISTVSYALSGKRPVPPDVRLRVRQAAEELDYQPDASARALRQQATRTLGLLGPAHDDPHDAAHLELTNRIVQAAAAADYDLLVAPGTGSDRVLDRLVRGRRVDGLILMDVRRRDPRIARIQATGVPFVLMGRPAGNSPVALVDVDYVHMVRGCLAHLAQLGHREIALMNKSARTLREGFGPSRDALDGFAAAAGDLGVRGWASCCDHDAAAGEAWAAATLADHPGVTAVVTVNEAALPGLYRGLAGAGRSVPGDISLTGVASRRWATAFTPELTAADLPVGQQAAEVVRMLIDRIRDPAMPVSQLVLKPGLTLRHSTAAPHSRDRQ
jgi:DNA-binding LacI/PurR family transcriptional regulator